MAVKLVGSDGSVVSSPPVKIAAAMLSSMFRVRNASTMVISGGTMLYHGAARVSAVASGSDRAAMTQMTAKMTTDAAVLVRVFFFTSSIRSSVLFRLRFTYTTMR